MAQTPQLRSEAFAGTRITCESNKPFDEVMSKLYASIGSPADRSKWQAIAQGIKSYSEEAREAFISGVNEVIGPHGFMIFQEFNHGAWVPIFGVGGGLKEKRIILGNPLIAITILKRDLTAGLFVPVEILVMEREKNGGTVVIYTLPSCLIAGLNRDEELVNSVGVLDEKLEVLVRDILA